MSYQLITDAEKDGYPRLIWCIGNPDVPDEVYLNNGIKGRVGTWLVGRWNGDKWTLLPKNRDLYELNLCQPKIWLPMPEPPPDDSPARRINDG